jgi:hypothetical protein
MCVTLVRCENSFSALIKRCRLRAWRTAQSSIDIGTSLYGNATSTPVTFIEV